ncbi:MAG: hypothetical protein ACOVOG_10600, partial [Rubrivivax sp.]
MPRLRAVRQAYGLERQSPPDYEDRPEGQVDPAVVAQARKRAATARDAWATVAGPEGLRWSAIRDSFALLQDSLQALFANGAELGAALQRAAASLTPSRVTPPPLAMEVATALLSVEAALD